MLEWSKIKFSLKENKGKLCYFSWNGNDSKILFGFKNDKQTQLFYYTCSHICANNAKITIESNPPGLITGDYKFVLISFNDPNKEHIIKIVNEI